VTINRRFLIPIFYFGFLSFAAADAQSLPAWNLFPNNSVEKKTDRPSVSLAAKNALPRAQPSKPVTFPSEPMSDDLVIRNMIGQMILIGFPGKARDGAWQTRITRLVQHGAVGGIILFSENVVNPHQVKQFTNSLLANGTPPPFVCVDQEGGTIQRLTASKGFVALPGAQQVAMLPLPQAFQLYRKSAQEMARLGINCNFGPVVDLNVNPNNPAIGGLGRSYDKDPRKVVAYARSFIDAYRQAGVLTAAKHFPGHGSAQNDPHEQVVNISQTWRETELDPFRAIIRDDPTDMVMVGHLIHPRFSDGNRPASLSRFAIKDALRDQLEYRGLVVSDDLDMGAIRTRYGIEEAAVMAVEAGNDLIIVANTKTPDPFIADRIVGAVSRAVAEGRISREAIEQSYERILTVKHKLAERRAYILQSSVQVH
jgi:beta-N-acetylhexosaminidase